MVQRSEARQSSAGSSTRPSTAARPSTATERPPWGSNGGRQPPSSLPLSSSSPHRCTFHHQPAVACLPPTSPTPPVPRNPLVPRYSLPSYATSPIPPPPFLGCSLDVSDIDGARPIQQQRALKREHSKRQRPPPPQLGRTEPERPSLPPPPPSDLSLPLPSTRFVEPFQPHPFPHRFQHSTNVVQLPSAPFHSTYHPALHDPLPSFDFSIDQTSQLPAHHAPLGGWASTGGATVNKRAPRKQRRRAVRDGQGLRVKRDEKESVSARVECWRESPAEEESRRRVGEWRTFHLLDVQLVQQLGMGS